MNDAEYIAAIAEFYKDGPSPEFRAHYERLMHISAAIAAAPAQAKPLGAAPVACTSIAEIRRMARGGLGAMATVFPPGTAGFNVLLYAAPQPPAQVLDAREKLHLDVACAIWEVMREYEDRCDMELEDVGCSHVVWQLANAAIAAQQGDKT